MMRFHLAIPLTSQMKLAVSLSIGLHAAALVGWRVVPTAPALAGGGDDQPLTLTVIATNPEDPRRPTATDAAPETVSLTADKVPMLPAETRLSPPDEPKHEPTPVPTPARIQPDIMPPLDPPMPVAPVVSSDLRPARPEHAEFEQKVQAPLMSVPMAQPTTGEPRMAQLAPAKTGRPSRQPSWNTSGDSPSVPTRAMPRYRVNPAPPYPALARRRGQQGEVLLAVVVTPEGKAVRVRVKQSSSVPALDQAAERAVRRWQFAPARIGPVPVRSEIEVPIQFKLIEQAPPRASDTQ